MDPARARKLADRIQQIVAEMLERRIKDPRLGFVTVTDARITGDLRDATVFYTVYGSAGERADTAAALESAKGVIRSEVGRQTGLRHTPTLEFVADDLLENAKHIDDLLAKARASDERVARAAEGARPAGEANPYRVAADEESGEGSGEDERGRGDRDE
jgi:ribosome-binding factor A